MEVHRLLRVDLTDHLNLQAVVMDLHPATATDLLLHLLEVLAVAAPLVALHLRYLHHLTELPQNQAHRMVLLQNQAHHTALQA